KVMGDGFLKTRGRGLGNVARGVAVPGIDTEKGRCGRRASAKEPSLPVLLAVNKKGKKAGKPKSVNGLSGNLSLRTNHVHWSRSVSTRHEIGSPAMSSQPALRVVE